MKKIIILIKKNLLFIALLGVVGIAVGGFYLVKKMRQDIKKVEEEIRSKYSEIEKYTRDRANAPSPELLKKLSEEKESLEKTFQFLLTQFSTSYPSPPQYKLYPPVEFKEYLFSTEDYLYKKARRNKVTIPSSFGFSDTGLPSNEQVPLFSLQLEVVKNIIEIIIDSGISVINNVLPGSSKRIAFYEILPIQVTITGTSVEIMRFLKYLENPSSYFVLDSFALSSTGEEGFFKADMTINAIMIKTSE